MHSFPTEPARSTICRIPGPLYPSLPMPPPYSQDDAEKSLVKGGQSIPRRLPACRSFYSMEKRYLEMNGTPCPLPGANLQTMVANTTFCNAGKTNSITATQLVDLRAEKQVATAAYQGGTSTVTSLMHTTGCRPISTVKKALLPIKNQCMQGYPCQNTLSTAMLRSDSMRHYSHTVLPDEDNFEKDCVTAKAQLPVGNLGRSITTGSSSIQPPNSQCEQIRELTVLVQKLRLEQDQLKTEWKDFQKDLYGRLEELKSIQYNLQDSQAQAPWNEANESSGNSLEGSRSNEGLLCHSNTRAASDGSKKSDPCIVKKFHEATIHRNALPWRHVALQPTRTEKKLGLPEKVSQSGRRSPSSWKDDRLAGQGFDFSSYYEVASSMYPQRGVQAPRSTSTVGRHTMEEMRHMRYPASPILTSPAFRQSIAKDPSKGNEQKQRQRAEWRIANFKAVIASLTNKQNSGASIWSPMFSYNDVHDLQLELVLKDKHRCLINYDRFTKRNHRNFTEVINHRDDAVSLYLWSPPGKGFRCILFIGDIHKEIHIAGGNDAKQCLHAEISGAIEMRDDSLTMGVYDLTKEQIEKECTLTSATGAHRQNTQEMPIMWTEEARTSCP